MKNDKSFNILLLIARPAAGKSEIIDFLKSVPVENRVDRFHVGQIDEIDDFPMLWTWFEEDALLNKMGHEAIYTDQEGYFLHQYFWDLLIERIALEYGKRIRDISKYKERYTIIVEFSRGYEHGGYQSAFAHLSQEMIEKVAVLYIDVPWEESLRKNRLRFNPARPDSILEHSLPDAKLEHLYKEDDWSEISGMNPCYLTLQNQQVPYVVFNNNDDVTSKHGQALENRLEICLNQLWELYQKR